MHDFLVTRGFKPKFHFMKNEAPSGIQCFLLSHDTDFQLVPPHVHRHNAAECAIQTFKDHLIAGIISTNTNFPMHLWCRLIRQAIITLNLLRTSRLHLQLSAHDHRFGIFNFNHTPLAPPGMKVIAHDKPTQRKSWAPHSTEGSYIGPARKHYRCYWIYIPAINSECICDTV